GGTKVVYSTYLGGTTAGSAAAADQAGQGLAVDLLGDALVAGWTTAVDFPVTSGAWQGTSSGGQDGFVAKLSPKGNSLRFATYLGGAATDSANALAVDDHGNAFVAGATSSSNFPTASAFQGQLQGTQDGFVTVLDASGAARFSSYLGGSGSDTARGIAIDP